MTAARGLTAAIAAGACIALVVACAAKSPSSATPQMVEARPEVEPPPLGQRPAELRARIIELTELIEADRVALGTEAPDADAMAAMSDVPASAAATTCARSPRATCVDVCKLGDSICENATSICELAAQLAGDAWAAERCNAGKASCQRASEKCCAC